MPAYHLSKLARIDLIEIAEYTLETWGLEQTDRYLDGLEKLLIKLARNPELGRTCNRIRQGYRRMEFEKHVVFYQLRADGIFVSRVLHARMLPSRQIFYDN